MDAKKLRIRIKEAMAAKDWNQGDLASHSGMTMTGISNVLTGKSAPTVETLESIGKALGKSVSYLLGESDENARAVHAGNRRIPRGRDRAAAT